MEQQQNSVVRVAWASLHKTHFEVWQRLYHDRESEDPITVRLQLKEHAALCAMDYRTFQRQVAWLVRNGWAKRTQTGQRHFETVLTLTAPEWALHELEAEAAKPVIPKLPKDSVLGKMEQKDFEYLIPIWRGLFPGVRKEFEDAADEFFVEAGITPTPLDRQNKALEIYVDARVINPQWRERLLRYFEAG